MKYHIFSNINDFDKYGLKINGYLTLLSTLGFEHLKKTDQGIGVLIKDRYAWVIISMKIKILKPILEPVEIYGSTWYSGRRGPYFRREYELANKNYHVVASSYSILLDLETRSVFRNKKLPFNELEEVSKHLVSLVANYREEVNLTKTMTRTVYNSYIDVLGHTNHLRYLEFIYDSLNEDEIKEVNNYNTLELFFQSEMLLGDEFSVNKGYHNNQLVFVLYNETKGEKAFTLVLSNE